MPTISLSELEEAFQWASAGSASEMEAYISKETGKIYFVSDSEDADEEEIPEDCDDSDLYWSVPNKNDLDLGKMLAIRFVEEYLPDELDQVSDILRRRGGYGRFKTLLEVRNLMNSWYKFESDETKKAILAWAEEQGITVEIDQPKRGT